MVLDSLDDSARHDAAQDGGSLVSSMFEDQNFFQAFRQSDTIYKVAKAAGTIFEFVGDHIDETYEEKEDCYHRNFDKIAIVGGGVAGLTSAEAAASMGYNVTVFESEPEFMSKTSSFPVHLHSGIIYPSLPPEERDALLEDSIIFIKRLPPAVKKIPTLVTFHVSDPSDPSQLLEIAKSNQAKYRDLVMSDPEHAVFGHPDQYYLAINRLELQALAERRIPEVPPGLEPSQVFSLEDWAVPFAKSVDLDQIKYPVIIVNEYQMSMDDARKYLVERLSKMPNVTLLPNTRVLNMGSRSALDGVHLIYQTKNHSEQMEVFQHVHNAAGESSGRIDDMMKTNVPRYLEAKQAFRVKLSGSENEYWPEVAIMAKRGGEQGMTEVIPINPAEGVFQLLCTAYDCGLTINGLVHADGLQSSHPLLPLPVRQAFENGDPDDDLVRSTAVIKRIGSRIPRFKNSEPLKVFRGIVQVPGNNPDYRSGSLMLHSRLYSANLIIKASSAPHTAANFVEQLLKLNFKPDDTTVLGLTPCRGVDDSLKME
jgi:hypothetical protein